MISLMFCFFGGLPLWCFAISLQFHTRGDVLNRPASFSAMLNRPAASRPPPSNGNQGTGGGGGGGNDPSDKPPKAPKPVSLNKKAAGKVSMLSSKITDVRCIVAQLENSNLLLG